MLDQMKQLFAMLVGIAALVAPLWFFAGMVPVPEYRTGTVSDLTAALVAGATLYGGVLAGVFLSGHLAERQGKPTSLRSTFVAGVGGAMVAITVVIIAYYLKELVTTGRLMSPGHTPALLPIVFIVGGLVSTLIAGGVALVSYALSSGFSRP